ncbi:MAG TPA: hypothetical protein EYN91_22145 [Candidatus Melainabacteria bacterium]|nr:hypothetical protein [Candidatus Melainabacteria bacterium]HIN64851.1 hypothetical protein [Candidatus Obscuribacterales bacterium]
MQNRQLQTKSKVSLVSSGLVLALLQAVLQANGVFALEGQAEQETLKGKAEQQGLTGSTVEQILQGDVEQRTLQGGAQQQVLTGGAQQTMLQGGTRLLNGSIKDEAALNPSLILLPGASDKNRGFRTGVNGNQPMAGQVNQFAGNQHFLPGQATPTPFGRPGSPLNAAAGWATHPIPPISSYTLTPRNGVMTFDPTYSVTPGSTTKGVTEIAPRYESRQWQSHSGVTSYVPGYEVSRANSEQSGFKVQMFGPGMGLRGGPMTGGFGFKTQGDPVTKDGVTSYVPGYEVKKVTEKRGSVSDFTPGGLLTHTQSRSGVVTYAPGYEVSIMVPGYRKETLGGQYSAATNNGLLAHAGKLTPGGGGEFAEPVVAQETPLHADALLLPSLNATVAPTWNDWYHRVAGAIYARWQSVDVGPGVATVRVTVTKDRNLSAQVEDFLPADNVARNVDSETNFKQCALNAVELVKQYEIPRFPENADLPRVTFDLEMKRNVESRPGFDVAGNGEKSKQ